MQVIYILIAWWFITGGGHQRKMLYGPFDSREQCEYVASLMDGHKCFNDKQK